MICDEFAIAIFDYYNLSSLQFVIITIYHHYNLLSLQFSSSLHGAARRDALRAARRGILRLRALGKAPYPAAGAGYKSNRSAYLSSR